MGRVGLVGTIVVAVSASALIAHHSVLPYDGSTATTLTGTVVKVLWQNPHTYIDLDVVMAGTHARWMIESEAPVVLERLGWRKTTLTAGVAITVVGARARDGGTRLRCATVTIGGRRLPCFGGT